MSEKYTWINYSMANGSKVFGGMVEKACEAELKQRFLEKKALVRVKCETLSRKLRK